MISIKRYAIALVTALALDLTWLLGIARSFYATQLQGFARPQPLPLWSGLLVWAIIPLGVVLFVDRYSMSWKESLSYGALYGAILYAVYDLTNYATLANFTLTMVVVDIIWGAVLCASIAVATKILGDKWQN